MVAGGVCSRGKSRLVVVPGGFKVGAKAYQEMILPAYIDAMKSIDLFPNERKVLFQQDMAPAHSAISTMKMVKDLDVWTWDKGEWPGNSPDLNIIEHIWNILQDSVLVEPRPTNRDKLIGRVTETWNSISTGQLTKLVESFPKRIAECRTADGKHTRY